MAVFAALVTYWSAVTVGGQFAISPPGVLHDVWYSVAPFAIGLVLSFAAGFSIGRWWAVLAGLAPLAALGMLELTGHVAPWHDAGPPLTGLVQYGVVFAVSTVALFWIGPIAVGVGLRRALGPRRRSGLVPKGA